MKEKEHTLTTVRHNYFLLLEFVTNGIIMTTFKLCKHSILETRHQVPFLGGRRIRGSGEFSPHSLRSDSHPERLGVRVLLRALKPLKGHLIIDNNNLGVAILASSTGRDHGSMQCYISCACPRQFLMSILCISRTCKINNYFQQ